MNFVKAHALGNDFLLVAATDAPRAAERATLARALCDRHRGAGADGVIFYTLEDAAAASMDLLNADGSYSEVSGNGVRCLAAFVAARRGLGEGAEIRVRTDAGPKVLRLLDVSTGRYTLRAAMGHPESVQRQALALGNTRIDAITLRVGNPQCVVLGDVTNERLQAIAAPLSTHPAFPQGTNVELAAVEAPGRVRILIWERGAGPTEASGTGACAAAVAAIAYGRAARDVEVVAPGGAQRVEWLEDGLYLTGWAELVYEARWFGRGITA